MFLLTWTSIISPNPETILCCHHILTHYATGSQVTLPRWCSLLERNTTRVFHEWWSKTFIFSTCSQHVSYSKRKQSDLSNANISKENGIISPKPKLKIVRSRKPLGSYVLSIEDDSSHATIPGINITIRTTLILAVPIQCIAPSEKVIDKI